VKPVVSRVISGRKFTSHANVKGIMETLTPALKNARSNPSTSPYSIRGANKELLSRRTFILSTGPGAPLIFSREGQLKRTTISTDQLLIARAFLREARSSKDWLNLAGIAEREKLDYYKSRRFLMKLVRRSYAQTRIIPGRKRSPLDFKFTSDGHKKTLSRMICVLQGFLSR